MNNQENASLFNDAQKYIPGGVNSPVRAFKGVGGEPIFVERGQGAHIYSTTGQRYIDYVGSWGPLILGHAHPKVLAAIHEAVDKGTSFGAPTTLEVDMAKMICTLMPNIEQVRMVNSGTEATMSAIRLARGYTGRNKIVKFTGCYHGHSDSLLVNAGSGVLTLGIAGSAGVPAEFIQHTLVASFNDCEQIKDIFTHHGQDIAAVILEPVVGNANCILPLPEFLTTLRELCTSHQSVLIFDEVMTGFRVSLGGAQALYNIKPDLTTLGKIIGGGLPVGAFGGRREIMQCLAPVGGVYQAGTLSGNPVAMAAGLAMLKELQGNPAIYTQLNQNTAELLHGLKERANDHGIAFTYQHVGSFFGFFFTDQPTITRYEQVMACNVEQFKQFFHGMLKEGVYFAPSAFEAGFMSAAHTLADLEMTLEAAQRVFAGMGRG